MLVRRLSEHQGEDGAKVRAQAAEGRRGWMPGKGHPKEDVTGVGEQRKDFFFVWFVLVDFQTIVS